VQPNGFAKFIFEKVDIFCGIIMLSVHKLAAKALSAMGRQAKKRD
jgi:hypothetical protein